MPEIISARKAKLILMTHLKVDISLRKEDISILNASTSEDNRPTSEDN